MTATEPPRTITGSLEDGFWERYVDVAGVECARRLELHELPEAELWALFGERLAWLRFLRWRVEQERE